MNTEVRDAPAANRYEILADGELVGFLQYQRSEGLITFQHTEVFPGHEGQGLAGTLVSHALDEARSQGRKVLPICPYVQVYLKRHKEYQDLDYRHG